MDAHLIENAADLSSPVFKDKGVYVITPKGLHILERFITKNGINAEHLLKVFSSQPICMKLLHLERNLNSDELVINQSVLQVIFRRFAGRRPNYPPIETETSSEFDRSLGVEVADIQEKIKGSKGVQTIQHTFLALTAVDWLCDFTTMSGREEAAELAAHFVRQRFVHLVYDKSRVDTDDNVITVHGDDGVGGTSSGDFRCHYKALYAFTDWGRSLARWPGYNSNESGQTTSFQSRESSSAYRDNLSGPVDESKSLRSHRDVPAHQGDVETDSSGQFYSPTTEATPPEVAGRTSSSQPKASNEHGRSGYLFAKEEHPSYTRDSNSTRLKQILEEPALRSLFRDFLKQNFCEENLSFWLDVQDFKRRFNTTSSAMAVQPNTTKGDGKGMTGMVRKLGAKNQSSAAKDASGQNAMEKHQQELVAMAFVIYNTYLAPSSSCELNIEHNLRSELVQYMSKLLADNRSSAVDQVHASDLPKESPNGSAQLEEKKKAVTAAVPRQPLHASQLQAMVRLYERIQDRKCHRSFKIVLIPFISRNFPLNGNRLCTSFYQGRALLESGAQRRGIYRSIRSRPHRPKTEFWTGAWEICCRCNGAWQNVAG